MPGISKLALVVCLPGLSQCRSVNIPPGVWACICCSADLIAVPLTPDKEGPSSGSILTHLLWLVGIYSKIPHNVQYDLWIQVLELQGGLGVT